MVKGIIEFFKLIGGWLLLVIFYVLIFFVGLFFKHIWHQLTLQWCYTFGKCEAIYYYDGKYIAKRTEEPDHDVTKYIDGNVVILNIKSNIVHKDFNCPAAKACTKNCIYIDEDKANWLIQQKQAKNCNYEFYTKKKCEKICDNTIEKLQESCMDMCIKNLYEDRDFSLPEFYFNMAEQSVPDEDALEEFHSNER